MKLKSSFLGKVYTFFRWTHDNVVLVYRMKCNISIGLWENNYIRLCRKYMSRKTFNETVQTLNCVDLRST
jgi:hypothetical protein